MKMKYTIVLVLCFTVSMLCFGIETITRCREIEIQLQIERFQREQKELELEKEIRLLKQDVYNLQYGYEGVENVRKN